MLFRSIIPRCLGGDNSSKNIVLLTFREHFICHHLLCKIYPQNDKIIYAFSSMIRWSKTNDQRALLLTSRHFDTVKRVWKPLIGKWNKGRQPWNKGLHGEEYLQRYKKKSVTIPNLTGYRWINDGNKQTKIPHNINIPNGWKLGRIDMSGNKNPMKNKLIAKKNSERRTTK